jgi:hypothetical protein
LKIELLVRKSVAGDELLEAGEDLERVRGIELKVTHLDKEVENTLEIGSVNLRQAAKIRRTANRHKAHGRRSSSEAAIPLCTED